MLATEVVTRPPLAGTDAPVWKTSFPATFLGGKGKEALVRTYALHLSELTQPVECTVWTDEEELESGLAFCVYLVFSTADNALPVVERIADDLDPVGSTTRIELSSSAIPVLKLTQNGNLIRLWSSPGPKVPERQKIIVDWGTFTVLNRVFSIEG